MGKVGGFTVQGDLVLKNTSSEAISLDRITKALCNNQQGIVIENVTMGLYLIQMDHIWEKCRWVALGAKSGEVLAMRLVSANMWWHYDSIFLCLDVAQFAES